MYKIWKPIYFGNSESSRHWMENLVNHTIQGQRSGTIAGARDTVGSSMVQKSGIQCYNCKEYRHVARECQKPKRAKDAAYHREKMLLCKQEEAGIQLNAEQADWRDYTDDESDDQELEANYMYMAKLQQVSLDVDDSGPIFDKEPEQKVQNDDDYDVLAINCQHFEQSESVHNTYLIEQDAQNDNSLRIHRNAGYKGQRSGSVARARDTIGSSMVQKSGIQCYNCKEYRHIARECQKPKRAKDAAYHREKMLLCKQEEAGIQLNPEQADWRDDTDDESDDQELEAHYMYMAKLQ
nr:hypothetical protein [Tanacetum cinerariifolium]